MTMPKPSGVPSTSVILALLPSRNSRPLGLPVPTKTGWTHRRTSSSRPWASSVWATGPNPYIRMSLPGCCLSLVTSWTRSPLMAVDDGGIGPVGLLQGGGGDVLGHGVDLVGEGAGLGRPGLGEALVGPPSHQQRVAGEQLV